MIGFTPRQVDEMSISEFIACLDGYVQANGGKRRGAQADIDETDLRSWGIEGF